MKFNQESVNALFSAPKADGEYHTGYRVCKPQGSPNRRNKRKANQLKLNTFQVRWLDCRGEGDYDEIGALRALFFKMSASDQF